MNPIKKEVPMMTPYCFDRRGVICFVLLLSLVCTGRQERIDPDQRPIMVLHRDKLAETAQLPLRKGDWDGALLQFNKVVDTANTKEEKGELTIAFAGMVETSARSTGRNEWLARSEELYRQVMTTAEGEVSLQAANNYCTLLLRSDRTAEAVHLMETATKQITQDRSLSPIAKSRSLYNYGRALEKAGDLRQAYAIQREAMKADPSYGRAAQVAAGLALRAPHEYMGIPELVAVLEHQLAARLFSDAASSLKDGLRKARWIRHDQYPALVGMLVRYFAGAGVDPQTYKSEWQTLLGEIVGNSSLWHACEPMLKQIETVYAGRLPAAFNRDQDKALRDLWASAVDAHSLSQFLTVVGDHFYRSRNHRGALGCYSRAWSLDTANMQAGLYAANILLLDQRSGRRRLDPNGALLAKLVELLWDFKAVSYMGEDWDRIVKFHIILGTIFETQEQWGPPGEPASAYYQWNHAMQVLDQADSRTQDKFRSVIEERLRLARSKLR
jgi:tetratricopeptide (TPR) repeat protein